MSIKLERENYRQVSKPYVEYGRQIPGEWKFLHKGQWYPVKNPHYRKALDARALGKTRLGSARDAKPAGANTGAEMRGRAYRPQTA